MTGALTDRERYWLEHLRRAEVAGQTLAAYAAAQGLKVGALYEAKSRLKRKGVLDPQRPKPPARFLRVVTEAPAAPTPVLCRVQLPNAVTLELGCAPEHWESLLWSLARL